VFFLTFLIFIAAEIASFVVVAEQIGLLWALVILVVVSALGPFIVRRVGFSVLAHTRDRLARGEVPTRELLDGLVVLTGPPLDCREPQGSRCTTGDRRSIARCARDSIAKMSEARTGGPGRADWL